jgi:hypothetical protein
LGAALLLAGGCAAETETEIVDVPYQVIVEHGTAIGTAEQFAGIGIVEGYPAGGEYYLTDDIDLSVLWEKEAEEDPDYIWGPIGSTCRECRGPLLPSSVSSVAPRDPIMPLRCENRDCTLSYVGQAHFTGVLHGNGRTVSGLKLPRGTETNGYKDARYLGLFGYVQGAIIHDLTVKVANTADERTGYSGDGGNFHTYTGVLAGKADGTRITNVSIKPEKADSGLYVTAKVLTSASNNYIGGVIGQGTNTVLKDVSSSAPLDVLCAFYEAVGGIAGTVTGDITGATVTGNITVESSGSNAAVAGICPDATTIRGCTVNMTELSLTTTIASGTVGPAALSGIGLGSSAVTDCDVTITNIKLLDRDTVNTAHSVQVGGVSAHNTASNAIGGTIERCTVNFGLIKVESFTTTLSYCFIGGVASNISTVVRDCSVTGGTIDVDYPGAPTYEINVGGIVGKGNVSHGSVNSLAITIDHAGSTASNAIQAGGITGSGTVSNSSIAGQEITVITPTTGAVNVGGLTGAAGAVSNSSIANQTIDVTKTGATGNLLVGGLTGGNGAVSNSSVSMQTITVEKSGTSSGDIYVSGLTSQGTVSNSSVAEQEISVETATTGTVYVGGLTSINSTTNSNVSDSSIGAQTIDVTKTGSTGYINVGGLAATGHISNSGVTDQTITVETPTTGTVSVGGLTGNGAVSRGFTGTATKHASLTVEKTDPTSQSYGNYAYVGGLSGQTTPTTAAQFENSYAFCDVTLETSGVTSSTSISAGQFVGGLAGYFAGYNADTFLRQSFARGSVIVNSTFVSGGVVNAGGIMGSKSNSASPKISACAALNSEIKIDGNLTTKNVKRIGNIGATAGQLVNNIATEITITPSDPPSSSDANGVDGLTVTVPLTEATFFGMETGQLGWDETVWRWDETIGYPVLLK